MKKIIISVILTLLLGPGVGHLYLRRFMKGFAFILVSFIMAAAFFWDIFKSVDMTKIDLVSQNPSQIFQDFAASHSTAIFYYDIIFAAIWAYALVDAFFKAKAMSQPVQAKGEDDSEEGD